MNWILRVSISRKSSGPRRFCDNSFARRVLILRFLVAGGFLVLVGCAPIAPRLELDAASGWRAVCAKLATRWRKFHSVEAEIRYTAETPWGNLSGFGKFAFDVATHIALVELRGPLGVRAINAYVANDTVWAYIPSQNALYWGRPGQTPDGAPVVNAVGLLILGQAPVHCEGTGRVRNMGSSTVVVGFEEDGALLGFVLDRAWGDLKQARIETEGGSLTLEYDGYRAFRGVRLPRLVRLTSEELQLRVALTLLEMRVNRGVRWQRYRFRIPDSAARIPISRLFPSTERSDGGQAIGRTSGDY